jgi:hypothetical protein
MTWPFTSQRASMSILPSTYRTRYLVGCVFPRKKFLTSLSTWTLGCRDLRRGALASGQAVSGLEAARVSVCLPERPLRVRKFCPHHKPLFGCQHDSTDPMSVNEIQVVFVFVPSSNLPIAIQQEFSSLSPNTHRSGMHQLEADNEYTYIYPHVYFPG